MTTTQISLSAINNAIREVCFELESKCYRPTCWDITTEGELWCELVACILGSRVRFEIAHSAVERLEKQHLFRKSKRLSSFQQYELDLIEALSQRNPLGKSHRYPFFRVRASQIRQAAERIYGSNDSLRTLLKNSCDIQDARRQLALEVPGLGPRQASLFLRNIGYTPHITILDIHVLAYMSWVGLTKTPVKSIPTIRKYEALESVFIEHAYSFGYSPDRFDFAVWVVVKVVKEEQGAWG